MLIVSTFPLSPIFSATPTKHHLSIDLVCRQLYVLFSPCLHMSTNLVDSSLQGFSGAKGLIFPRHTNTHKKRTNIFGT